MRTVKSKTKRAAPRKRAAKAAALRTDSVKSATEASAEVASAGREPLAVVPSNLSNAVRQMADLDRAALDSWAKSGAALAKGAEDVSKIWLRLSQQSMENGIAAARAMLGARTLQDLLGVQSDYARSSFGSLVAETARFSELSIQVAQEAMRPLQARFGAAVEKKPRPTA